MKVNGSKPGEVNFFLPLSNGLLSPDHRKRLGIAVWEFLWFINRTTKEKDGFGIVLGGKPIKYSEIASALGVCEKTVAHNCRRLSREGYIRMDRTPYGFRIYVAKSKKFAFRRPEESFQSEGERVEGTFPLDRNKASGQSGRNLPIQKDIKEDIKEEGSKPAGKKQADPRFQPVVNSYFEGYRKTMGEEADFDKADGAALKRLLGNHQDLTVEEIGRRLQNAFTSTADWPLSRGFRFTEFARHHAKFKDGPKHRRNGAGGNGNQPVQIPEPKKLSKEDERVYEQYRGSSQ